MFLSNVLYTTIKQFMCSRTMLISSMQNDFQNRYVTKIL